MSEYDDWKQENDRWEAYLYPNGVLRNKLGITKAAKWHKTECEFVAARNTALRPNTGLTTGNVGEELFAGTTSACAENTQTCGPALHMGRNYLRVRGEYVPSWPTNGPMLELPPRARRIRSSQGYLYSFFGTTSACAENTATAGKRGAFLRNYLRVRGEYPSGLARRPASVELPPRARRILTQITHRSCGIGTTSACAENTRWGKQQGRWGWNYLRVRGEYPSGR